MVERTFAGTFDAQSELRIASITAACGVADVSAASEQLALLARDSALAGVVAPVRAVLAVAPEALASASGEACYWIAQALLRENESVARDWFVRAVEAAQRDGDRALAQRSVAAALVCYQLSFDGRKGMKYVLDAFTELLPAPPTRDQPERALLLVGRLCASYESRAFLLTEAEIDDVLAQVVHDLPHTDRWPSPALQLACAVSLVDFVGAFLNTERARDVAVATSALAAHETGSPRLRALWWIERSWLYANDSEGKMFGTCLTNVDALAAELNSEPLRFQAMRLRCATALRSGRVADALALLPAFEHLTALSEHEYIEHSRLRAGILIMAARPQEALGLTEAALRLAHLRIAETGGNFLLLEMEHVHALAAAGRLGEAAALTRAQAEREYGTSRERLLAKAHAYDWQSSGGRDEAALRLAVELASRANAFQLLARDPATLARLCDAALRRDFESQFVGELIVLRRLTPPPFASERWPWPVRIETLGGFRLYVRGKLYRPEHKAQDKVLELLKLLVAASVLRRGEAERDWLCEQLWPGADAARARKSLESSVARLRRLLQQDAAVVVSEGRVSLDAALVWSDSGAFVDASARITQAQDGLLQQRSAAASNLLADVTGLLGLYKGRFLEGDADTPWVLGARAQFSRLLRQSLLAFEQHEDRTQPRDFMLLLERAHALDPASEEIAQLLMRHHLEQANHVEALRVYRRTRDTIQAVLGATPSPRTEMLGQEVFRAVERDASAHSSTHH